MMDLISEAVGGRVVECNDEFFAGASNLLRVSAPVWKEGEYTDRGKWMDGWETRRRRDPGHDWCVLALGIPGSIESVTVDTSHFTGNYPEYFSLEACGVGDDERLPEAEWKELIAKTALQGDAVASFQVRDPHRVTHVRVNIFPDGGVARLRVAGAPIPRIEHVCPGHPTDLASAIIGGEAIDASDRHYSEPANLVRPGPSEGMWDGWETRRRRGPGNDWADFRLGLWGTVERVIVDTTHFRGNAPGWVSIDTLDDQHGWHRIVSEVPVAADKANEIDFPEPILAKLVRLSIHPDGGVARFRVIGNPAPEAASSMRLAYLNSLLDQEARRFFRAACASSAWVEDMVAGRPFESADSILESAGSAFELLGDDDWLEAFAGHPRIGERGDPMASAEQSGAASASRELISRLGTVNEQYEDKFGFTYIVYATGKTAEEMLRIAERRLANGRREEIDNAAREQRAITVTRLRRMLCLEVP